MEQQDFNPTSGVCMLYYFDTAIQIFKFNNILFSRVNNPVTKVAAYMASVIFLICGRLLVLVLLEDFKDIRLLSCCVYCGCST